MTAYYNEHEPYAAQWLRHLIAAGHIAPGDVDARDIQDVTPDDLAGYTQCHFFAVFTDLSTAVERSGSAPGLGPSEWDEQWPTSVSGAASVRRACRVLAEGPI